MSRIHVKCLLVVMDTEENMSDQLISAMHRSGLPIMLITSKYYPLLEFDCIHLDEYSGIIMGVQHLQKRGYQRIACISDRISLSRVTVFKQAMKLQGMKVDPQLICVGPAARGERRISQDQGASVAGEPARRRLLLL